MWQAVGVDIGGSGVRAGLVRDGRIELREERALDQRTVSAVLDAVASAVQAMGGAARVGIGMPGFVSQGVLIASPNFPFWRSVPMAAVLSERLGVAVTVENDANCAAVGAWDAFGQRGDLALLTLGTGVGGGVITGGRLLRGAGGTGAEVGHIFAGGDRRCGCGGRGCLETWVGTAGLLSACRDLVSTGVIAKMPTDGKAIVDAARAGEAWAQALFADASAALGRGLVTLVNLFNPDDLVITGGLAAARDLLEPAEAWMRDRAVGPSAQRVAVHWDGRADDYAIIGAARASLGAV